MDLYREEILEHWRNPNNFGKLDNADLVVKQINPLCGDEVTFFFKFSNSENLKSQSDRKIVGVSFIGSGCAISIASSSILSENIKGKGIKTLSNLTGKNVLSLVGGQISPARLKCVFLPLEAIRRIAKSEARSTKY